MLLSVLIPTVQSRSESFTVLRRKLADQITRHGLEHEVEILHLLDNRQTPIGQKRNELVAAASGQFVVFIDDDDDVSDEYLSLITAAIRDHPDIDCVGIRGRATRTRLWRPYRSWDFSISITHQRHYRESNILYYTPNHLSPIRREIAIRHKFPELRVGEDTRWSAQIRREADLHKEYYINQTLYYYHYHVLRTYSKSPLRKVIDFIRPDWLPIDSRPFKLARLLRDRLYQRTQF